jgi:hypothetical protein
VRRSALAALAGLVVVAVSARTAPAQVLASRVAFTLPDTNRLDPIGRELIQLERVRNQAIVAHDTTALRRMYAPEFRAVAAMGAIIDRRTILAGYSHDNPRWTFKIDELNARALDPSRTAAILTARLRTFQNGALAVASRYVHVYAKRDGRWQIVAAQATFVPVDNRR